MSSKQKRTHAAGANCIVDAINKYTPTKQLIFCARHQHTLAHTRTHKQPLADQYIKSHRFNCISDGMGGTTKPKVGIKLIWAESSRLIMAQSPKVK